MPCHDERVCNHSYLLKQKSFCSQNFWLEKNVHLVIERERERERDKAHGQLENKPFFNGFFFLGGDQWVLIIHDLLSFFFLDC
jgi:hypothetical protein